MVKKDPVKRQIAIEKVEKSKKVIEESRISNEAYFPINIRRLEALLCHCASENIKFANGIELLARFNNLDIFRDWFYPNKKNPTEEDKAALEAAGLSVNPVIRGSLDVKNF